MRLFDDFARTDAAPMRHADSSFAFLNRSSWQVCDRDRQLYEQWFSHIPADQQKSIRGRFVSELDEQHLAACFELLLHEILIRLGCDVKVEPDIIGIGQSPDFLVTSGDRRVYVEATALRARQSRDGDPGLEGHVYDWLNKIKNPDFMLDIETEGQLVSLPKRESVVRPFKDLMGAYHSDDVLLMTHDGEAWWEAPSKKIRIGNWTLTGELVPKRPERRGDGTGSTIRTYPAESWSSPGPTLARKIVRKVSQKHASKLDAPFLVAVNTTDGFFDVKSEMLQVLLGDTLTGSGTTREFVAPGVRRVEDAVWIRKTGELRYPRLHGVWVFVGAASSNPSPAGQRSYLYVNPFVDTNLPASLYRVPHSHARGGVMEWFEGESLDQLLAVPEIPWDDLRCPILD